MAYMKTIWNNYDDQYSVEDNIKRNAVVTDDLMNKIEAGIYKANNFSVGTVETDSDETKVSIIDTGEGYTFNFSFPKGVKGDPGKDGMQGIQGEKGEPGKDGLSATIKIGEVTTGESGSEVKIENVGTDINAILNISIPKGADGKAASIKIGTVTTVESGEEAKVENVGTDTDVILNFTLPKGDPGEISMHVLNDIAKLKEDVDNLYKYYNPSGSSGETITDDSATTQE